MDTPGSFGHWLRHRRRELDLTQDALARQVGCARITIRKLEEGQMRPSRQLAVLLLERLEVPLEEREDFMRYARGGLLPASLTKQASPNNIPNPISSFVGRERELTDLKKLVLGSRLVTVTGAGGIGKTRFAIEAARGLFGSFEDGIWWVELAPVRDPAQVMGRVAKVLGVREVPNQPMEDTLVHCLRPKQLLIVLDNCEHLIEACARAAEKLLTSCVNVKILATSREHLGVTGEMVFRMPPLTLPGMGQFPSGESLLQYEAILLFVQRANAVNQQFSLSTQNAAAVVQVCRQLDGIPLAIELAAARIGTLSPEQVAARLDDRFALLTDGSRTAPSRHQTLHAAMDWSHDLLTETEQELFRQLAVFAGGFTAEALESVARLTSNQTLLDVLSRIVDKSLVVVEYREDRRYNLLKPIRQYALEKLDESGDAKMFRNRHLGYFLRFAEEAEPHLYVSGQRDWMNRLELEHSNLREALTWSLESGQAEAGLRMVGALARFWLNNGYLSEGRHWLDKMLTIGDGSPATELAKALLWAAKMSRSVGDNTRAQDLAEASIRLYRELGDQRGAGSALAELGVVLGNRGNREQALEFLEEGLQLLLSSGDLWGIAYAQVWLGDTWFRLGDTARAASHWKASLHLARGLGDNIILAFSLGGLADVARLRGDYEGALEMLKEALALYRELGNKSEPPFTLEALGFVATARGQAQRAARLLGAASAWREAINEPLPSGYEADYAPCIAQVGAQLGEEVYASAWSEGYALSFEQAIEYALKPEEGS